MSIETISYLNEEGVIKTAFSLPVDSKILVQGLKMMLLTRLVDERMVTLQRQGEISFALSSFGEEACSVASVMALSKEDWLYPQYRECGIMFARGYSIQQYVHQMFGNGHDVFHGRQMPNHFGSRELNVVQVSSPIATQIPHAAGAAYAMKLQQTKTVSVAYFGEGATSEGDFHVGLNFAAVRKAPTLFFCRNNGYAISTPACKQFVSDGLAPQTIGRNIKTFRVDGNDFLAVYETVFKARQYALENNAPVFIEAMTYRLGAHSTSDDPTAYRKDDEVNKKLKACPIARLRNYLQSKKLWNKDQEEAFLKEIQEEINQAIKLAKTAPRPKLKSLITDVYFEIPEALNSQYAEIEALYHEE